MFMRFTPCRETFCLLHLVQVANRQLEDVSFLQLGDVLALGLQRRRHDVLQLVQTLVDPCSTFPFEQRFHHLPVLMGSWHRRLTRQVKNVTAVVDAVVQNWRHFQFLIYIFWRSTKYCACKLFRRHVTVNVVRGFVDVRRLQIKTRAGRFKYLPPSLSNLPPARAPPLPVRQLLNWNISRAGWLHRQVDR